MAFEFPLDYDITQILIEVNSSLFMYPFMGRNIALFKGANIINAAKYITNICFVIRKTQTKKRRGFKKKTNQANFSAQPLEDTSLTLCSPFSKYLCLLQHSAGHENHTNNVLTNSP